MISLNVKEEKMKRLNRYLFLGLALCAVYGGVCLFLHLKQDSFLYHPWIQKPDISEAQKTIKGLKEVSLQLPSGKSFYAWYKEPTKKQKVIVFFHGNSYHVGYFVNRVEPFVKAGYGILMPEYEGFGGVLGPISQENMERVSKTSIVYLNSIGFKNKDIILYGYSLGTYNAVYVAASFSDQDPFDAVILESPFTSLKETADKHTYGLFPLQWLMNDFYDSSALISQIKSPLLIGHGRLDKTVPYDLGVSLFDVALEPKTFFSSDLSDHRTLPDNGFLDYVVLWLKHKL